MPWLNNKKHPICLKRGLSQKSWQWVASLRGFSWKWQKKSLNFLGSIRIRRLNIPSRAEVRAQELFSRLCLSSLDVLLSFSKTRKLVAVHASSSTSKLEWIFPIRLAEMVQALQDNKHLCVLVLRLPWKRFFVTMKKWLLWISTMRFGSRTQRKRGRMALRALPPKCDQEGHGQWCTLSRPASFSAEGSGKLLNFHLIQVNTNHIFPKLDLSLPHWKIANQDAHFAQLMDMQEPSSWHSLMRFMS